MHTRAKHAARTHSSTPSVNIEVGKKTRNDVLQRGWKSRLSFLKREERKKTGGSSGQSYKQRVQRFKSGDGLLLYALHSIMCLSIYMCTARLGAAASSPHQKIHHRRGFAVPSAIASSFGVREAMSRPVSGSAVWASSAATLRWNSFTNTFPRFQYSEWYLMRIWISCISRASIRFALV